MLSGVLAFATDMVTARVAKVAFEECAALLEGCERFVRVAMVWQGVTRLSGHASVEEPALL